MREEELIALLKKRDKSGLEKLLAEYTPLMRYIVSPILPDPRDREECLADMAMKIWDNIEKFDPGKGSFTTWLTVLTRNAALNRARQAPPPAQELTETIPAPGADPAEKLLARENTYALRQALASLNRRDLAMFYRKYYYRQTTAQIASEMGLTVRAVEGRLYRIKKQLRAELGGDFR